MFQAQRETSRALHSLKEATDVDCIMWRPYLYMARMFESRFEWSNAADSYVKAVRAAKCRLLTRCRKCSIVVACSCRSLCLEIIVTRVVLTTLLGWHE
jgi:hypothetical protein